MKPVAWIKIRELGYMKGVVEHGASSWSTNLGLVPEPDDEGLYTETQVQQLLESFEQSVTDPENQPSQYGTVPLTTGLTHYSDEQLLFELVRRLEEQLAEITAERNRVWWREHWTEYEYNIAAAEREACIDCIKAFSTDGDRSEEMIAAILRRMARRNNGIRNDP